MLVWNQMGDIHVMERAHLSLARALDGLHFDLHILLVHSRIIVARPFE
jgi:hypothetical protein